MRLAPVRAIVPMLIAFAASGETVEASRTLRAELAAADLAAGFAVENLAGSMKIVTGSGDTVTAVATVHGESDAVLQTVRFEKVRGENGLPALRVRYPLDQHPTIRYGRGLGAGNGAGSGHAAASGHPAHGWLRRMLGHLGSSHTNVRYDGQRVQVSDKEGTLLYADVEVRLPARAVSGAFRNLVGRIDGEGLEGKLRFDSGSGDIVLSRMKGDISADTGSGNVNASAVDGSYACNTGSGDCSIERFSGEKLHASTGSGEVSIHGAAARRLDLDTGSGDISGDGIAAEEITADTGSGDVLLSARGSRLASARLDTGSGDVRLRLGPDAAFVIHSSQGSGRLVSRYADALPIERNKELVGYRRGDGQARIDVDTGSGDVTIEPGE